MLVLELTTEPGDPVAIFTPGYPPFLESITRSHRRLVPIPLLQGVENWALDRERLTDAVSETSCRVLVLVNPHNPTGRVFTDRSWCGWRRLRSSTT